MDGREAGFMSKGRKQGKYIFFYWMARKDPGDDTSLRVGWRRGKLCHRSEIIY